MERYPVVNSHNDWSRLEEIIVGSPFHLDYSNDVSFRLFFHDNLAAEPYHDVRGPWVTFAGTPTNRVRDEMHQDLEGFISLLRGEDVIVRRPEVLREPKQVTTPHWTAPMGHALMSRDLFVVIGDEIIETAPMVRSRYFEGDLYKALFTEYFNAGARWTAAPRSRLLDRNFDFSYAVERGYRDPVPDDSFYEIMFDGPQILRLGRDLVFNCSTENHRMGLRWLQRHLEDDYTVHEIAVNDHHIDGAVVALRPGTLLVHRGVDTRQLPERLRRWDVLVFEPTEQEVDNVGLPVLASEAIGMNVLSIDEDKIVVQDTQLPLIRQLEAAGFTPMPCRWRHGRLLGGGFHCITLDVRRRSRLERYLDG